MKNKITDIINGSLGEYIQVVYDSDLSERRRFEFSQYQMKYDKTRNSIRLCGKSKKNVRENICQIDLSSIVKWKTSVRLDMKCITIFYQKETIRILIYKYKCSMSL